MTEERILVRDTEHDNRRCRTSTLRVLESELDTGMDCLGELQARGEILADENIELGIASSLGIGRTLVGPFTLVGVKHGGQYIGDGAAVNLFWGDSLP